jgi:hypothetical protein
MEMVNALGSRGNETGRGGRRGPGRLPAAFARREALPALNARPGDPQSGVFFELSGMRVENR